MITVQVKLFATLRRFKPGLPIGESFPVRVPPGATAVDLLDHLELPADEVKMVFINGIVGDENRVLCDGDEIGLFPPVGGG